MKVLLFLNGPFGIQTGIEDGFLYLESLGEIKELKWFYYDDYLLKTNSNEAIKQIMYLANDFQPNIIVFFHIRNLPISSNHLNELKSLSSNPIVVYDEGDMYGTWAKPITKSMKIIIKHADIISLRGLGKFAKDISKINHNIIYTPHHADIARFDRTPYIIKNRKNFIVSIGNKIKPRYLSQIRRLPGAAKRERFIKEMGRAFNGNFSIYGNGWKGFIGNRGPIEFQHQMEEYKNSWVTVAYEHYPTIPYYFSNRLPIALMAGSLYVCHYHKGYDEIFKDCDFIFFFRSNNEAIDIINFIRSLSKEELIERSKRAREFALKYYHPNVVWSNFYNNILRNYNAIK